MSYRLTKTDAGRNEIKQSSRKLPRAARNLLLIIDGSRPAADWVQLIHGASAADLALLVDQGLIERHAAAADAPQAPARTLDEAVAALTYDQVYGLLTSQARDRLGLIKGYMMILEVERCAGLVELRALAVRFVGMVRAAQGEAAARQMCSALGLAA